MKFVKLRNDQGEIYGSYVDFWHPVNLAGFDSCEINEIQLDSDETYIMSPTNGNAHEVAKGSEGKRRCKIIAWNLERPVSGYEGFAPGFYDAVWVSDQWMASELQAFGAKHVRYVPLGGHPNQGGTPAEVKTTDLIHCAYMYGRRNDLLDRTLSAGYSCYPGGAVNEEKNRQLATARAGLCLHQDHLPVIEPLRYTLFAAWKLPIVAEASRDYYPYKVYGLNEIPAALRDDRGHAEQNYRLLAEELTFRKCVEAAL